MKGKHYCAFVFCLVQFILDLLCRSLRSILREEKSIAHDVAWYFENMGLKIGGIDVLSFTEKDVPTFQIEEVFRPKFSKNGSRYDRKFFAPVVHNIFELYRRVTGRHKAINGHINKGFA